MRAQFLGRRTTSCWSSLVDVVLDVSVLDWLEDGRWCLLSFVCVGVGFKCRFSCVVFFSLSIIGHFLLFRELVRQNYSERGCLYATRMNLYNIVLRMVDLIFSYSIARVPSYLGIRHT